MNEGSLLSEKTKPTLLAGNSLISLWQGLVSILGEVLRKPWTPNYQGGHSFCDGVSHNLLLWKLALQHSLPSGPTFETLLL